MTVVLPVYNGMPYLRACLDSLAGQSIRRRTGGGLEVVAVDDGSTDGGGAELCAFAARNPGLLRVVHQANSGGPAAPGNRALDLARGRYLFFLGADDRLGEEALERLVALADRAGSDVVLGRMVGVGGRLVPQGIFEANRDRIGFTDSALAWALSDAKLFRRELVERYGLRKREDLPAYSDQPFTLEACLRSRRISVLADYDCYYAVQREDRAHPTVRARHEDRLRGVAAMLDVAQRLAEPGAERAALRSRAFRWEIPQLLTPEFLALPEPAQRRLCAGVGRLVELHGGETGLAELPVRDRLRLDLARRGRVAALRRLIRYQAAYGESSQPVRPRQGPPEAAPVAEPAVPVRVPVPVPVRLWRGLVPARVRRRLHRRPAWREFTGRTYRRWLSAAEAPISKAGT